MATDDVHCIVTATSSDDGKTYAVSIVDCSYSGTFVRGSCLPPPLDCLPVPKVNDEFVGQGNPCEIHDGDIISLGGKKFAGMSTLSCHNLSSYATNVHYQRSEQSCPLQLTM